MYKVWFGFVLSLGLVRAQIILEYKPQRPFYHPNPGNVIGQIIPPARPWPSNLEGYQNFYHSSTFLNLEDRIKETSANKPAEMSGYVWLPEGFLEEQTPINSEYKPDHPKPGSILEQMIPPRKPLPNSPGDFQNFNTNKPSVSLSDRIKDNNPYTTEQSVSSGGVRATPTTIQKQTPINLEYKPTRPFYHPNPGNTVGQIIPPGKPWPSSPEDYQNFTQNQQSIDLINRLKENDLSTTNKPVSSKKPKPTSSSFQEQTPISIEYQPNRPPFHPNPGSTLGQVVPPGKPWPSNAEDYQNFSQTAPPVSLEDRIKETSSSTNQPTTLVQVKPTQSSMKEQTPINIEYQPNRPSFHPNPGSTLGQIVPPGKPWPSNAEDYQNFSQTAPPVSLEDRIKETSSSTKQPTTLVQVKPTQSPTKEQTSVSLEYKPNRPFHHPNPGNTVGQIVPPGKPWPSNSEDYQNFSQTAPPVSLEDRIKESNVSTTNRPISSTQSPTKRQTPTSLEYQPNRPFYHPNPGNTIGQIVPPGKPWPSNAEDYQNFSQTAPPVNLEDRIKETSSTTNQPISSTEVKPTVSPTKQQTSISLEYKPNRPFYHPNPGNTVGQVVPPGKPWPSNVEDYQNFSQPGPITNLEDRIKEPGASTNRPSSSTSPLVEEQTPVNLEYKPSRPFHHPNPGSTLGQIVRPGKPGPNNTNLVENFNQTTTLPSVEIFSTPKKPESAPNGFWWPAEPNPEDKESSSEKEQPRSSSAQPDALEIGSTTTIRNEEITSEGKLYTSKIVVAESSSEGTPVTSPRGKIA